MHDGDKNVKSVVMAVVFLLFPANGDQISYGIIK